MNFPGIDTCVCRQMLEKLDTDLNLTPTQTAEITTNMEKAGCGRRLPGP